MKAYTIYFYSGGNSCITHFSVDGKTKKRAEKLGRDMTKLLQEYYKELPWANKITFKVEEYKSPFK